MNCTGTATGPQLHNVCVTTPFRSNQILIVETTGWLSSVIAPQTPDTSTANFTFTDWSVLGDPIIKFIPFWLEILWCFRTASFMAVGAYDVGPDVFERKFAFPQS